jgi:poly-beta-1,6-N-acetyl-D-glucosamine N-deacetylase
VKTITSTLIIVLSALVVTVASCFAAPPLTAELKTTMQQDPYANDGMSFRVLCYHDVRDELRNTLKAWPESAALDTRDLIEHFEWLKANGYHVVSLNAVIAARKGGAKLPPKALLLTFDDGYLSTYTRVFPLLKLFNYPAVIGLVGEWLEAGADGKVLYGDRLMARENFVTWTQVQEMTASGLVEVASHSYGLHKGARSNPQGNMVSAAITRIYEPAKNHYENDAEYIARIRADLGRNSALIARHTGKKPRVMIWPYGAYNLLGVAAAEAEGMPITMNLDAGSNTPDHPLAQIRRDILFFNDKISDLKRNLNQRAEYDGVEQPLDRIVTVDLDSIYDPDPVRQENNLGALIERILRLRINTIYLRAVADTDGDGLADAAYFPNRHLPMRTDLFNRVAWQLRTRAVVAPDFVNIYAWLPVQAFKLPADHPNAPKTITEIYEDLGNNAPRVAGVVFGADATLSEFEDTRALAAAFKAGQPNAMTARIITPATVLSAHAKPELTQPFANALKRYDFVVLSAKPEAHDEKDIDAWLSNLVNAVMRVPGAINTTAFLLDSMVDQQPIASARLAAQLRLLQRNGARNFGYSSDNVARDHPALAIVRPAISLKTNPGRQP